MAGELEWRIGYAIRPISSVCPVILSDMVITPLIGKIWMKICLF